MSTLYIPPAAEPLGKRELATVLAALRYWQNDLDEDPREKMPEHFKDQVPLTPEEIDALCERLNS